MGRLDKILIEADVAKLGLILAEMIRETSIEFWLRFGRIRLNFVLDLLNRILVGRLDQILIGPNWSNSNGLTQPNLC